jgi:hypothetical protein
MWPATDTSSSAENLKESGQTTVLANTLLAVLVAYADQAVSFGAEHMDAAVNAVIFSSSLVGNAPLPERVALSIGAGMLAQQAVRAGQRLIGGGGSPPDASPSGSPANFLARKLYEHLGHSQTVVEPNAEQALRSRGRTRGTEMATRQERTQDRGIGR